MRFSWVSEEMSGGSTDRTNKHRGRINATDDTQAIALAETIYSATDFELWNGKRFVCMLTCSRANAFQS
jgi:hypothetical protein